MEQQRGGHRGGGLFWGTGQLRSGFIGPHQQGHGNGPQTIGSGGNTYESMEETTRSRHGTYMHKNKSLPVFLALFLSPCMHLYMLVMLVVMLNNPSQLSQPASPVLWWQITGRGLEGSVFILFSSLYVEEKSGVSFLKDFSAREIGDCSKKFIYRVG